MRARNFHIGLLAVAASMALQVSAKPAKQGVFTLTVADGTEIRVRLAGDEFFHQYFTEDGYPIFGRDGYFYYGDYDSSGNAVVSDLKVTNAGVRDASVSEYLSKVDKAGLEDRIRMRAAKASRRMNAQIPPQSAIRAPRAAQETNDGPPYERGYGLFPEQRFPAYGDQKAIVILVEYKDVKFSSTYDAHDYFSRMLNEDGFSDYGGTGGAAEYFRENSGDSFRPVFDVYGPITLANNRSYYGGNDWGGDDQNPGEMVKEACDALDATVDFSEYDRNNDGIVDNIYLFYAGRGEASGGGADTVWPHSWNMASAGYPGLTYDGVEVYTYGCSNEWEEGRPDGVGTFVHEFSHVMGLPDLYATSYTSAFTPRSWSALDYGPYNNDGMTPPNYGAFERYALGWMKPSEITEPLSANLKPIDENMAGIIRTGKDTEFFLIENRQQTGWDKYIPGHGMLVWHVDYNGDIWKRNVVNNTASHQYVDIEEADGTESDYSRSGDSFPGTSGKTQFTATTRPAMKTWSGQAVDYPITNIAEAGGIISFDVLGGAEIPLLPMAETLPAENVTTDSFTARWINDEGLQYRLSVFSYDDKEREPGSAEKDSRRYLSGFKRRNVGEVDSYEVKGLEPGRLYFYTLTACTDWHESAESDEIPVTTERLGIDYYRAEATEATDISADGFTANWLPMEDAVEYYLTVSEMLPGDPYEDICDFSDFKSGKNDRGWSATSTFTYSMASNCGEAVPSLRLSNGNSLMSPVYPDGISSCSFWHRGINNTGNDKIEVIAMTPAGQKSVLTVDVDKSVGGVTTVADGFPENTSQVLLKFVRNGDGGYLALDDVTVFHGLEYVPVPVAGYDRLSAGADVSYGVKGLRPTTDYVYTVCASDGNLYSKESDAIRVRTNDDTGIGDAVSDEPVLSVDGLTISVSDGAEMVVSDITGIIVARGEGTVVLSSPGFYLVNVPSRRHVEKLIIK